VTRARTAVVATGLLGWLVACGGVLSTGEYQPVWLESGTPCELAGECTTADVAAGLERAWWVVGAGLALLAAAAVVLGWVVPARGPAGPGREPLPAPVHALIAGLVAFGTAFAAGGPLFFASFGGDHALTVALATAWLAQAATVLAAGWAARSAPAQPGHEWLAALVVSGLGTLAVLGTWGLSDGQDLTALPVVDAIAVTFGVLGQRSLLRLGRPPVWTSVAGGLAVLAAGVLLLGQVLLPGDRPVPVAAPVPQAQPVPTPTPRPTPPAPLPTPTPTPTPTPEPVVADAPCAQQDLAFSIGGFDGAMGLRAAALVATNTGSTSCWLEGVPVVVLLQGGRPLALQVGEGQTPEGGVPQVQRVGVAPGGTASALLTWRTYGGWADAETPQAVTVALDATTTLVSAALPAGEGPAPFDLADGGAWGIAPWAGPAT
jgi:hypothetical protein